MCRIAGIVGYKSADGLAKVTAMRDSMIHGGPDDEGIFIDEAAGVYFGHRRLSLIDLSKAGHQPMLADDGKLVLIFNGEIYNYLEIRKELELNGIHFTSKTDTEVIIQSFHYWGVSCFSKFNGMFAIAIFDKNNNKIILARDHAGIKPLYYSFHRNRFIFSSETRAFISYDNNWKKNPDWRILFLLFGHMPEPYTTLNEVFTLQKGSYMSVDCSSLTHSISTYLPQKSGTYSNVDFIDAVSTLRSKLTEAVNRHLISDAPIGLFLSGGIDSSILTLIAKNKLADNLQTLSIDFEESKFSEKQYQDIIIKKTGANHQSFIVTKKMFDEAIEDIISAMDQPSNDGINSYFISKFAKQAGLKAVLSGIGADELFGGYPSFKRVKYLPILNTIPKSTFSLAVLFNDDKKKKFEFCKQKNAVALYMLQRGFFTPSQIAQLLEVDVKYVNNVLDKVVSSIAIPANSPINQMAWLEENLYMKNQLLKDTDYMSMWHAIEVRVPFLDKELMSFCEALSSSIRFSAPPQKKILIEAFEKELPVEIWDRPKRGFVFPFQEWFNSMDNAAYANNKLSLMRGKLASGKIHWSRYWSYYLSTIDKHKGTW